MIQKSKKKDLKWQMARGICIMAVILIHCPNASSSPQFSGSFRSWLVFRQFVNFPVAFFFFLAGYFTDFEKALNTRLFYKNRGGDKLFVPFVIWSMLYSAEPVLKSILQHQSIDWCGILLKCISGRAAAHLYFVVVLIQLVLLTPLLIKLISSHNFRNFLYLITPLWLVFLYIYTITQKEVFPYYHILFPAWIGFYVFGLSLKAGHHKKSGSSLLFVSAALFFEIAEAFFLLKFSGSVGFASSQIRFSAFLYAFQVIMFSWNHPGIVEARNRFERFMIYIGDRSYGIFYIHLFFVQIGKILCQRLGLQSWLLKCMFTFFISLTASLIFMAITRKILIKYKMKRILPVIGFS